MSILSFIFKLRPKLIKQNGPQPDNYEIIDPSLADIIYVLDPTFAPDLIRQVEHRDKEVRAFCGTMYLPGVVGLNNIKVSIPGQFSMSAIRSKFGPRGSS
jgi:hypothetical protein